MSSGAFSNKKLTYPLKVNHYYTWSDPDGLYVYLVFRSGDKGSYLSTTRLCEWCHSYGPSDQIGMLTIKPNARKTVGILLCLDLGCISRIETLTSITKKSFDKLSEQLCERITAFFEKNILNSEIQEAE